MKCRIVELSTHNCVCAYQMFRCFTDSLCLKISATRFYSSGAYLYVNYRLSEIKWLLFKASTTLA